MAFVLWPLSLSLLLDLWGKSPVLFGFTTHGDDFGGNNPEFCAREVQHSGIKHWRWWWGRWRDNNHRSLCALPLILEQLFLNFGLCPSQDRKVKTLVLYWHHLRPHYIVKGKKTKKYPHILYCYVFTAIVNNLFFPSPLFLKIGLFQD